MKVSQRTVMLAVAFLLALVAAGEVFLLAHTWSGHAVRIRAVEIVLGVVIFPLLAMLLLILAAVQPVRVVVRLYEVFVRAPPGKVWDAHFMHLNQEDWRPNWRVVGVEKLADAPPTWKIAAENNLDGATMTFVQKFPVYERPVQFRCEEEMSGDPQASGWEQGELIAEDGGTRLRIEVHAPATPLSAFLARRRVARNLAALAAYCEGRPGPPRIRAMRSVWLDDWIFWIFLFCAVIPRQPGVAGRLQVAVYAILPSYYAVRSLQFLRRFL